jgi:hypothetical protein
LHHSLILHAAHAIMTSSAINRMAGLSSAKQFPNYQR